jgi:hypothetical protein
MLEIGWDRNGGKKARTRTSSRTIGEREGVGRVGGDRRERNIDFLLAGECECLSNRSEEAGIARPREELQSRNRSPIVLVLGFDRRWVGSGMRREKIHQGRQRSGLMARINKPRTRTRYLRWSVNIFLENYSPFYSQFLRAYHAAV